MLNFSTMQLLYCFTVAMLLTTVLMPVAIRMAPILGLVDRPDSNRKVHAHVIPRCGGMAMAIGITAPLLWYLAPTSPLIHLLIGALLIVVFGLLDDRNNLNYRWKFFGQILAVLIVMHGGFLIHRVPLLGFESAPPWLSHGLTFFFILGVTNAVNLTDGLDGLAAGTTLLALAVLFTLTQLSDNSDAAFIALTVIGGILGFLRFNTFPARVFMGDAGSQLLGFIASTLAILVTQADTCAVSPVLPLLILGLPVLDTFTVMTIRILQKRSPFSPDRNHLHHQIMALGFRHNEAVAIIYVLQISLLTLAFTLRYAQDGLLLGVYLVFSFGLISLLAFARCHGWQIRHERSPSFADRRNLVLRKLGWFHRNSSQIIQLMMALLLILPVAYPHLSTPTADSLGIILIAIVLIAAISYPKIPAWSTRLSIYSASVLCVYLMTINPQLNEYARWINAAFIALAGVLALAIRMTRQEHFRLDTQDLLILSMILIVPMLPLGSFNRAIIGEFTLRLAVLMYCCEFVIGKSAEKKLLPVNSAAMLSMLLAIVLHGTLFTK